MGPASWLKILLGVRGWGGGMHIFDIVCQLTGLSTGAIPQSNGMRGNDHALVLVPDQDGSAVGSTANSHLQRWEFEFWLCVWFRYT